MPNLKDITRGMKENGGKIAGGGLAGVMVWCRIQFPTQREFDHLQEDVSAIRRQMQDVHTQVVVLDAIRRNEQTEARGLYE